MKIIKIAVMYLAVIGTLFACSNAGEDKSKMVYNQGINITPTPQNIEVGEGKFKLTKNLIIVSDDQVLPISNYFATKIEGSTGYKLAIQSQLAESNFIHLELDKNVDIADEGYSLEVVSSHIHIKAKDSSGLFYGVQTLLQLFPAEIESSTLQKNVTWEIPTVTIHDVPRFQYRGMLLDAARHFQSVEYVKRQLDMMALLKINVLHWHITDDQGWRIEIKKYPELTAIGSVRQEVDGTVYGPKFYTQEDVKEIVAYAKERFITVIPEIELPGHAEGALAAFPQYSCSGEHTTVRNIWGVATNIYCAGNDDTFKFLENVLEEVLTLFDSKYIHIGGDEAPKDSWIKCPKCQARIKALGLKADKEHTAEEKLQSYFVQRIQKFLTEKGRSIIGWDEILEGGLAPSATVMSWRGEEGSVVAGNMGHDVILVPYKWLYIDYYQSDSKISPIGIGHYVPLQQVYDYNPVPEKLDEDKRHHVKGVQANVWTEYMYSEEITEWYTYPRIIALSEIAWSPKEKKDYTDFLQRLENQRVRMDMHGINYFIPLPEDEGHPSCNYVAFVDSVSLGFSSPEPVRYVYTTDGTEPTRNSKEYTAKLSFRDNAQLKIRSVVASGKMGSVRTIEIAKEDYRKSLEGLKKEDIKLHAKYFPGETRTMSDFKKLTPTEEEDITFLHAGSKLIKRSKVPDEHELYSTEIDGYINVEEDGVYYFSTDCDQFWIANELLINNEGEVKRHSRADKSIALKKGYHPIKLVRLSGLYGGWVPQWDKIKLFVRKSGDSAFRETTPQDFK